jgi:hypothetical protein
VASNRKRKEKLWNIDCHCFWCGCKTILESNPSLKKPDPRMATIDHLRSKFNPERWERNTSNEVRTVLACFSCNNKRASKENASRPIEELRRRGKGFKLKPNFFKKKC